MVLLNAAGAEEARFGLAGAGSAIASDPSGEWVVAGSRDGTVAVFAWADEAWRPLESAVLHQGEVHSLSFEPDELRFRSAGADNRFLITHARGALEAIDRGGRHGHSKPVSGIVVGAEHVYTAGADGHIKAWRKGEKRQPATQKQGVGEAVALTAIEVDGAPHLAIAVRDASIRLFPLEEGKVQGRTVRFNGAIATAHRELEQKDPERRRAAIETLEGYADADSIELLALSAVGDDDHQLRLQGAEALGRVENRRAVPHLEELLRSDTEAVRWASLLGLRRHVGEAELRPLSLALQAGYPDVGMEAVRALSGPAASDEQAHVLLVGALSHRAQGVREAALGALETLHPGDPTASRLGLRSSVASLRWLALLRLFQRGLLEAADREIRAATEDEDADVRQAAYLLRVRMYPRLSAQLRAADADLHRNLHALETHGQEAAGEPPPASPPLGEPETLSPLLQAVSARQRDTCLRGASHLALLGDGRAFGVLLQLSREGSAEIKVRACRALQRLDDPRALGRMQAMLRTSSEEVRDAAFSVIERLLNEEPLRAAEIGLSAPYKDVRGRGLRRLTEVIEGGNRSEAAINLLRRALDDDDARVRNDAFKAVLRLEIDGGAEPALRFALQSSKDDVRREVLTEVMSQVREDWAWRLLLERLDDPAASLRTEAFDYGRKHGRGRDPDVLVAALGSRYPEVRLKAVRVLSERVDERAQPLLVRALEDEDETVRVTAFWRASAFRPGPGDDRRVELAS